MRLISMAGALALAALTFGAAPSFAQERYAPHDDVRVRVANRRPTLSLSLVFGNARPYYSSGYGRSRYYDRGYTYGRSSRRSCDRGGRAAYGRRWARADAYGYDERREYGGGNRDYGRY